MGRRTGKKKVSVAVGWGCDFLQLGRADQSRGISPCLSGRRRGWIKRQTGERKVSQKEGVCSARQCLKARADTARRQASMEWKQKARGKKARLALCLPLGCWLLAWSRWLCCAEGAPCMGWDGTEARGHRLGGGRKRRPSPERIGFKQV